MQRQSGDEAESEIQEGARDVTGDEGHGSKLVAQCLTEEAVGHHDRRHGKYEDIGVTALPDRVSHCDAGQATGRARRKGRCSTPAMIPMYVVVSFLRSAGDVVSKWWRTRALSAPRTKKTSSSIEMAPMVASKPYFVGAKARRQNQQADESGKVRQGVSEPVHADVLKHRPAAIVLS